MLYSLKYTDSMPGWKAGYSRAWFVRIRPAYKDDIGVTPLKADGVLTADGMVAERAVIIK